MTLWIPSARQGVSSGHESFFQWAHLLVVRSVSTAFENPTARARINSSSSKHASITTGQFQVDKTRPHDFVNDPTNLNDARTSHRDLPHKKAPARNCSSGLSDYFPAPMNFHNNALPRGNACLNCRKKKQKCDGVKPICHPCEKSGRGTSGAPALALSSRCSPSATITLSLSTTSKKFRLRVRRTREVPPAAD